MNEIGPVLGLFVMMFGAVVIVRMVIESGKYKREAAGQLQLHTRLIDKFGSSKELLDYLQSDAGKRFLTPATIQKVTPYRQILGAAQAGIVLTFVGVACWLVRGSLYRDAMYSAMFLGSISLAVGLGFLCSAVLAHVLSRKWGLLNGNGEGTEQ